MKIISVVGARPNFMKAAPFIHEINKYNKINNNIIDHLLVHTGQHYDDRMSVKFFKDLNIPNADINLGIGSGTHSEQVGKTMIEFEKILFKENPDWVVVFGDVNATLACSVAARKLHIKVCHIEAGLRSGDETMPEEINRLVTDRISNLLLVPDKLSIENLLKEGVSKNKIEFVGNIMIDTLENHKEKASATNINDIIVNNIFKNQKNVNEIEKNNFGIITMHRPSNVDDKKILEPIIRFFIDEVSKNIALIWPVHPRTKKQLIAFNLWDELLANKNIFLLYPIGYHDMLKLNMNSKIMFTDSGGLQEECTILGTKCLTLRWNTERPITLKEHGGVSLLVGNDVHKIRDSYKKIINIDFKPTHPKYWDGKTAFRCLECIINFKIN
tara:strand:+ start:3881 stop:5035 length:1155 start_codon:yes stop_codon:yes gene_type:complete